MKKILFFLCLVVVQTFAQPTCSISGSYNVNTVVPRPDFGCSSGAPSNPRFEISGAGNTTYAAVENWNNNTNQTFGNVGNNRLVRMVSITCGGSVQNTTVACGSINIIDPSSIVEPKDAVIDITKDAQVIRGFGGMNYSQWQGSDLTQAQRETAFGNGDNQLGLSILRIHVDANSGSWQQELATAKSAVEHGVTVFASPWDPPESMRNNVNGNKHINTSQFANYARHLNDFVTFMKNNGVNLYAISVQNEPDYGEREDWTGWTATEIVNFLKNHASSIDCRIMAPESFQYVKSMSDPILNDATALANMDILGAHMYGTPSNEYAYPLFKQKGAGKELWMTEVYYPNSNANSGDLWPEALGVAEHIHKNLVDAEFQAYVWWFIRRSYGPMNEDGTISKRGYMMAHFSKFIRPGYIRVDATKTPNTDVFVSSYKGDGKLVIVAVNKQASTVNQNFVINGNMSVEKMENWVSSQNENLSKKTDINVNSGSFTAGLPARSVTTFVGELQALSSSSSSSEEASSSSEEATPIPNSNPKSPIHNPSMYYTLKGEPLGSKVPNKPGVYIVKEGYSVKKVVVK